jgi:hypothetical protein
MSDFKALDPNIEEDFRVLHSREMNDFVMRCREQRNGMPDHLGPHLEDWGRELDTVLMGQYCSAVGGFVRAALVKSRQDLGGAAGMLQSPEREPVVEVFAERNSPLAEENAIERGFVTYSAQRIGMELALRAGQRPEWGEIAWRSIAACLIDCRFPAFPGLEIRPLPGAVELRLLTD